MRRRSAIAAVVLSVGVLLGFAAPANATSHGPSSPGVPSSSHRLGHAVSAATSTPPSATAPAATPQLDPECARTDTTFGLPSGRGIDGDGTGNQRNTPKCQKQLKLYCPTNPSAPPCTFDQHFMHDARNWWDKQFNKAGDLINKGLGKAEKEGTEFVYDALLKPYADSLGTSAANMLTNETEAWLNTTSVKPCAPGEAPTPVVVPATAPGAPAKTMASCTRTSANLRGLTYAFAALIALAGVVWQGIQMMISRRSEPLVDVVRGVFSVTIWIAVGIAGPALLMEASDAAAAHFWSLMPGAGAVGPFDATGDALSGRTDYLDVNVRLLLSIPVLLAMLAQKVIMLFREASVTILAGLTVVAAAGSFTRNTRQWLPKVIGWMLALITYKPIAALVYLAASMTYQQADDERQLYIGIMMLFMAIVALPVMMRLFTWTTGQVTGSGLQATTSVANTYALYGRGQDLRQ